MEFKNNNSDFNKCSSGLCCTKIENLCVTKGNQEILKNVNLHIHCGELTALIGANGAGKSTLLKAILVDGNDKMSRRPIIGYVPQKLDFDYSSPVSVLDVFACTQSNRPVYFSHDKKVKDIALRSLRKVQGENLINKRLGVLSGGELQRILLALALEPIPDILLLDEPVSGIDQNGLKLFYSIVSNLRENYDLSIILVSHDLNVVYEKIIRSVTNISEQDNNIDEELEKGKKLKEVQKEIERLENKMKSEKQFNKKVELNKNILELKKQKEELSNDE